MLTIDKSVTSTEQQLIRYNISQSNNSVYSVSSRRTSRFFFDNIFRISSGVANVFGFESDDEPEYEENNNLSTCDCGES